MSKLIFYYGCMNAAKTTNLLCTRHQLMQQGKIVYTIKPSVAQREPLIQSRIGMHCQPDLILPDKGNIDQNWVESVDAILVDEAQFLAWNSVVSLRMLDIPLIICYGLRTDWRGEPFSGSKMLLGLADSIVEIKSTCEHCGNKATMHRKVSTYEVDDITADYESVCFKHWSKV